MTKRGILSGLANVYDPLGVGSPVIVVALKIFQDSCNQGTGWDSLVTLEIPENWDTFLYHTKRWHKIEFARFVLTSKEPKEVSLQLFSDASKMADCTAVYIVLKCPKK